jgi:hypothetical protein
MGFENPIVGGTALRIPAIQSPNYVPGVSGWIIKITGDAEFNNLVVRGEFSGTNFTIDANGIFFYNGTPANGNLTGSWAQTAGTDPFGNAYAAGITLYSANGTINHFDTASTWNAIPSGAGIQIGVGAGSVLQQFAPNVVAGVTWDDGGIGATLANRLGTNTPQLFLVSPQNDATHVGSSISLYGSPQTSNGDVLSEMILAAQRIVAQTTTGWIDGAWVKTSETWQAPSYGTNWASSTTFNTSTNWAPLQFRRDAEDNLVVTGAFKSGAVAGGVTVFQFPVGYRPNKQFAVPITKNAGGTITTGFAQISGSGNFNLPTALGITPTANAEYIVNGVVPLGNIA